MPESVVIAVSNRLTLHNPLNTPNLVCPEARLIRPALDLYVEQNIDFIDAYHAFYLKDEQLTTVVTYDRKLLGRVNWLEIVEP